MSIGVIPVGFSGNPWANRDSGCPTEAFGHDVEIEQVIFELRVLRG